MNGKMLDAEWISRFFGTSHIDVRADKTQNWITQKIWNICPSALVAYIKMMWLARILLREDDPEYWCGVVRLFEDGIRVDGTDIWDAIENPVETNSLTTGVCWTDELQTRRRATS
jgi:hypothetical protein